jgi:hypothetical protein
MQQLSEEQLAMLVAAERTRMVAPLNDWSALAAQLRHEGLMRSERRSSHQWWMRIAAGIAILLVGAGVGRATATRQLPGWSSASGPTTTPVSSNESEPYKSIDEAMAAFDKAQIEAERAATFVSSFQSNEQEQQQFETNDEPSMDQLSMMKTRLAALDGLIQAARSALFQSPGDPVINRYYLTTVGAREATLQQLNQSLPKNMKIEKF